MLADEATIERLSNDEDLFEAVEEYGDESTTIAYDIDKLWLTKTPVWEFNAFS